VIEFKDWMTEVDFSLDRKAGIESGDLADWNYRDAWVDGMRPKDVAAEVLEENGFARNALNIWMPDEENLSLGSCGCTDYHMADCPTRGGI